MLFKRSHDLVYVKTVSQGSYQDSNGDWHPGETTEEMISVPCYSEPNGQNEIIKSQSGQSVMFNRIAFLDRDIEVIPYSTKVSIYDGENLLATGTVELFEKQQKHCNIWM